MQWPAVIVIAPDEPTAIGLRALGGSLGRASPRISVVVQAARAAPAVARAREQFVRDPLCLAAHSEPEAFDAIAAGADDACVVAELDARRFRSFLHRVVLRAERRVEIDNRHAAVVHAEKLASLGTLVAGVAHEINAPLSAATLLFEQIRSAIEPLAGGLGPEIRRSLSYVPEQLAAIAALVRDLKAFTRAEDAEPPTAVHLPELTEQILRTARLRYSAVVEHDFAPDVPHLLLPRHRLVQVLTNLLSNAAQAVESSGRDPAHNRVLVSIHHDQEAVAVSVRDNGPGIAAEILERIFDPFFTTKRLDDEGGTGLGLPISRSILRALGGDLLVESVHGDGATFVAIVPKAGRVVESPRRLSVLVVGDDPRALRACSLALRPHCDLRIAEDAQQAIDLIEGGSIPDAILLDGPAARAGGPSLHAWLRERHPPLADRAAPFDSAVARGRLLETVERLAKGR